MAAREKIPVDPLLLDIQVVLIAAGKNSRAKNGKNG
jgi:hypothetical protein